MKPRIDARNRNSELLQAMLKLETTINDQGLEPQLLDLMRLRASQINGCAYCIDMHAKDLRALGESDQRLDLLNAWRESPFYSERERAALAWTEAVTLVAVDHVADEVWDQVRAQFNESEIIAMTFAIAAINGWNRLNVAFRTTPGTYRSPHKREQVAAAR